MSSEDNRKKRVLFIDFGPGFGGSVVNLTKILTSAGAIGIEPYVVTDHCDEESLTLLKNHTSNVVYMKRVKLGISETGFIARCRIRILKKAVVLINMVVKIILNIPFYLRVARYARKISADIVQFNNIVDLDEVIFGRIIGKKTICHAQRAFQSSMLVTFLFRSVDHFIAISNFIKKNLMEAGVPEEKISLIYNAVDIDEINQLACEESNICDVYDGQERLKVGIFGCLLLWKGHDVFIDAVDILVNKKKIDKVCFYVVGASPDTDAVYEKMLIKKIEDLNLKEYFQFTGYVRNVFPLMKKMDIVLNPSNHPEAFGLVVIESMALSKPVIATNHGGPAEIIQNGKNGFLVEPGNVEELADAINDMLFDQEKRKKIGLAGRIEVEQKFSMDVFARLFRKMYE